MSKVRLYISGNEVDFGGGENLLLFTYAAGELDAPAVVQNSYSKEITLPPTARNAQVFGALWKADKVAGEGEPFDTLAREPFEIRSAEGELLESGYVKLASASRTDGYVVNLYGGLGAFLYGLMYNGDGSKKSLADLVYGSQEIDAGLNFNIDKTIIQAAWDRLGSDFTREPITTPYDVVNFAPMHNGLPEGFDAGKGLVPVGSTAGCPPVSGMSGKGGYALVDFGKEFNEWEVRDLRSYLQRPVFRIAALLYALEDTANNGGYTFDWSSVRDKYNGDFINAWMSLRMLHTEGVQEVSENISLSWSPASAGYIVLKNGFVSAATPASAYPSAPKLNFDIGVQLRVRHPDPSSASLPRYLTAYDRATCVFFRLIGYDAQNAVVATSAVKVLAGRDVRGYNYERVAVKFLASKTGTTAGGYIQSSVFGVIDPSALEFQYCDALDAVADTRILTDLPMVALTLSGYAIDHIALAVETVSWEMPAGLGAPKWGVNPSIVSRAANNPLGERLGIISSEWSTPYARVNTEGRAELRSGAYISKKALLGDTPSPAELLLSLVKTFGLMLAYDGLNRKVSLLNRGDFYAGEEMDIDGRIDRNSAYVVEPDGITAKWLDFSFKPALGGFAEYYRGKYGFEYGSKRVDTGSPFNVDTIHVLEGVSFLAAVTGIAYSRYFYLVRDANVGTGILPSPYLDNASKYTLWDAAGKAQQYDVASLSSAATLTALPDLDFTPAEGFDGGYRIQLAAADGRRDGDGAGMLIVCDGWSAEYVHLSDDNSEMLQANGTPCWLPYLGTDTMHVPEFMSVSFRHNWGDVSGSLDMGTPVELAGRDFAYEDGHDLYSRRWRRYIADRYSRNAHRVTCFVDWTGVKVEQAMFARFYWFDGCWWVLERIEDYCWDNPQPTKCTFVRVLDKEAYTNGQS